MKQGRLQKVYKGVAYTFIYPPLNPQKKKNKIQQTFRSFIMLLLSVGCEGLVSD